MDNKEAKTLLITLLVKLDKELSLKRLSPFISSSFLRDDLEEEFYYKQNYLEKIVVLFMDKNMDSIWEIFNNIWLNWHEMLTSEFQDEMRYKKILYLMIENISTEDDYDLIWERFNAKCKKMTKLMFNSLYLYFENNNNDNNIRNYLSQDIKELRKKIIAVELKNNEYSLPSRMSSLNLSENFIESIRTILDVIIQKFNFSIPIDSFNDNISSIFNKLFSETPIILIPDKLSDNEIAGAIFYFVNSVYGNKKISFNQIYDSFSPHLKVSKEVYRKHTSEFYYLLRNKYGNSFKELVLNKVNKIINDINYLEPKCKTILIELSKKVLQDLLNSKSEKKMKIRSDSNPEIFASTIIYLISRIRKECQFLDSVQIGSILNIDRKLIVNFFHKNFKLRYINELKKAHDHIAFSRKVFLKMLVKKYEIPNQCEKLCFKLLGIIQDERMGNYIDKTVALTIIHIISQICDDFYIPLEHLCQKESASESSIHGCLKRFFPFLKQFIRGSENLQDFKIDILELELLIREEFLEKIKFCINFITNKYQLASFCSDFALGLIYSLIENGYEIQPKEIKSLSGKAVYLGIRFFDFQGTNNVFTIMDDIGTLIGVHKDNIEKQGEKLRIHYKKKSYNLVDKYISLLINKLNYTNQCEERAKVLLTLIYNKWWSRKNPTFGFSISLSPIIVFLASILTDENKKCNKIELFINKCQSVIPTLIIDHFERQLSTVTKYIANKDFLKIIAHIYNFDIFPSIRLEKDISHYKAPLFSDVKDHNPFYYYLIVKRNYRYVEDSIFYDDILAELGFNEIDKKVSKYFPYIGGGVTVPKINRLKKLDNYQELKNHIRLVFKDQGFPMDITSKIVNAMKEGFHVPRISTFKIKGVRYKQRIEFERKYVKSEDKFDQGFFKFDNGYIKKTDTPNIYSYYCNPERYRSDAILGHGQPNHNVVMDNLLKNYKNSIVTEMPIWIDYSISFLTGHIDLLEIEGDTIKIDDYKPKSFFHSIPQVATYALTIIRCFNIKKVKCVIFNKDKVWEFEPISTLKNVMKFLKSLSIELFWFKYVDFLLDNQYSTL